MKYLIVINESYSRRKIKELIVGWALMLVTGKEKFVVLSNCDVLFARHHDLTRIL